MSPTLLESVSGNAIVATTKDLRAHMKGIILTTENIDADNERINTSTQHIELQLLAQQGHFNEISANFGKFLMNQ